MANYRSYKDLGNNAESAEPKHECEVITTKQRKEQILKSNTIVLIDIYGDWCHPCRVISPAFEEMVKKYNIPNKVYLCKEDVDKELSPNCSAVPMFCFYVNGVNVKNIHGGDMKQVEASLQGLISGVLN